MNLIENLSVFFSSFMTKDILVVICHQLSVYNKERDAFRNMYHMFDHICLMDHRKIVNAIRYCSCTEKAYTYLASCKTFESSESSKKSIFSSLCFR